MILLPQLLALPLFHASPLMLMMSMPLLSMFLLMVVLIIIQTTLKLVMLCFFRDPADPTILTDKTRHLGLVVCKGRCVPVAAHAAAGH